jgi:glycosyltransferase involved in cell wall biosynthesis
MTRKLPVVIAGTNCLSGVTTWTDQLRAALADHPRYDVRLLYVRPDCNPENPPNFDICASSVEAAHQVVRKLAPVVVVPNYVWDLFLLGFEPGVYCVGMCHADSDEQYYSPLAWYEPIISQFIAVSGECAERLMQRIPCRANEIATLPYGIGVPQALHRNYQVEPLRLVYAGRVTQLQKRVWDFVPLVEHLVKAHVHFVFDIVGEGDEFTPLQEAMRARFPAGCVHFHGRMPHQQMPDVWSRHDVFLQVSDFEGTSISMLEAMAHGVVPVVTAASSGIAGVIRHQENGFVVPVGDMAGMAQVMARLAVDEPLLATIGRAAHQTAQAFSMVSHREKFTRILDRMVQAGQEVDAGKRYGRHAPRHPLLWQQQRIVQQQEQIKHWKQGAIKRFLKAGYQTLLPSMMRRPRNSPNNDHIGR